MLFMAPHLAIDLKKKIKFIHFYRNQWFISVYKYASMKFKQANQLRAIKLFLRINTYIVQKKIFCVFQSMCLTFFSDNIDEKEFVSSYYTK